MYEVALSVAACLRAGTRVDVAWVVETRGFAARDLGEALAVTPGGGRVGAVLSGSLDDQLVDLAERGAGGRLVDLNVGELAADLAGLACGGDARCLLVPAADLPAGLWEPLRERQPVCLVTRLDGDRVTGVDLYGPGTVAEAPEEARRLFGRGVSGSAVAADSVVTVFWPVPNLVVVGGGGIAEALRAAADLLGWRTQLVGGAAGPGVIATLGRPDKLVVISHDDEVAGAALAAALAGDVGYVGALGSHRTQRSRANWLALRGITDLSRVHGPAGLDIGANTPAEIAVAILAEALAAGSGRNAASLRDKAGSIHS